MIKSLGQKEDHILQIAMQVFLEKGWHGTRMQEIADRAGINKAMLHYYFRSKERLYTTILEKLFIRFMNSLADSFKPGQDFATTLRTFLDRFHDHLLQNPNLPLFIVRELSEGGKIVKRVVEQVVNQQGLRTPQMMINEFKHAQKRGEIIPIEEPVQFLLTVIGACVYFFLAKPILNPVFPEIDFDSPQFIEQRKKLIFEHLYLGIKNREKNP